MVVSNSAWLPAATLNACEPITPPGPLSVITISSVRSPQFAAKPLRVTWSPSQADAGTWQLTLLTHGGVLQVTGQPELVWALVVPQSFEATALALYVLVSVPVQLKVNVVS